MTTSDKRGWGSVVVAVAICAVLLPVLYVLSIGPAVSLAPYFPRNAFETIYEPLLELVCKDDRATEAMIRYLKLWPRL